MDTEMARTFLEVTAAGSFMAAADRLHVTQSTVSTRIQQLEQQLGCRLFVRNKTGATLTSAGLRFQRHAAAILRLWEQARQEATLPAGHKALLRIGSEAGLWNRLLYRWIPWMRRNANDIALRCDVGLPNGLLQGLQDGTLDVAVLYSPRALPGLSIRLLLEEELVLFRMPAVEDYLEEPYVHIDWGDDFRRNVQLHRPDVQAAPVSIGVGTLGLDYVKQCGGTGHFPRQLVQPLIDAGKGEILPEARPLSLPIYAAYPPDADDAIIDPALTGLKAILGEPAGARDSL